MFPERRPYSDYQYSNKDQVSEYIPNVEPKNNCLQTSPAKETKAWIVESFNKQVCSYYIFYKKDCKLRSQQSYICLL